MEYGVWPPTVKLDKETERLLKESFKACRFRDAELAVEEEDIVETESDAKVIPESCSLLRDKKLDLKLKSELQKNELDVKYRNFLEVRKALPVFKTKQEILDTLGKHQVVVISGETGCGKTTQVSQFILDDYITKSKGSLCHVVCTQPRRISAVTVAKRVAEERVQEIGKNSVGYQIRCAKELPNEKRGTITYCTTGVVLQWMQSDPKIKNISHIILDEVHERDVHIDCLMALIRDLLPVRPDLKVILMSATINAEEFSDYFGNCPYINIPGELFPVKEYYLEDALEITGYKFMGLPQSMRPKQKNKEEYEMYVNHLEPYIKKLEAEGKYSKHVIESLQKQGAESLSLDLVFLLIKHICLNEGEGAILVFLPGWYDIRDLQEKLTKDPTFKSKEYEFFLLYSKVDMEEQEAVFQKLEGVRKIVLATNIAETSITIDDVVFVIDCARVKVRYFRTSWKIYFLEDEFVTQASARQRKGRAGRVKPGVCYHLYIKEREKHLQPLIVPEMTRSRLEEVILQIKYLRSGKIRTFLRKVMSPPSADAVRISIELLEMLNALDEKENLTPLGQFLAQLPLDPFTAKMVLLAAIFGCVDPVFSAAASLNFKEPFVLPRNKEEEEKAFEIRKSLIPEAKSDHLTMAVAVLGWEEANKQGEEIAKKFCKKYYLSHETSQMLCFMKWDFCEYLYRLRILKSINPKDPTHNMNSYNVPLVKAIICAGLYPNVALDSGNYNPKKEKVFDTEDGSVRIHRMSSVVDPYELTFKFLVYYNKMKTSDVFLYDVMNVSSVPLLFFAKSIQRKKQTPSKVDIQADKFLRFSCDSSTVQATEDLRSRLGKLLADKIDYPDVSDWSEDTEEGKMLREIVHLLGVEEQQLENPYEFPPIDDVDDRDND